MEMSRTNLNSSLHNVFPQVCTPPPNPLHSLTANRSYLALSPRTRVLLGVGVMAWSGIGLYISDNYEKKLANEAAEAERKRLRESLPVKISVVERDEPVWGEKR